MGFSLLNGSGKVLGRTLLGCLAGAMFGVCFGALASVFQGGPDLLQGVSESTPWFAVMGGVGAFLIALERN